VQKVIMAIKILESKVKKLKKKKKSVKAL